MVRLSVFVSVHNATREKGLAGIVKKSISATVPFFKKQGAFEFSVALVGERAMRKIAKEWKGKDKATDVLSFGFVEQGNNFVVGISDGAEQRGEIIICVPVAKKQAKELGISLKTNIATLTSHGTIHVFGLDHDRSPAEYEKTMRIQQQVITIVR